MAFSNELLVYLKYQLFYALYNFIRRVAFKVYMEKDLLTYTLCVCVCVCMRMCVCAQDTGEETHVPYPTGRHALGEGVYRHIHAKFSDFIYFKTADGC